MADPNYRQALVDETAGVDWDAARVPTEPVADDQIPPEVAEEDHANEDESIVLDNGDDLNELHDDGSVDQGVVGDGAFVPAAWWNV